MEKLKLILSKLKDVENDLQELIDQPESEVHVHADKVVIHSISEGKPNKDENLKPEPAPEEPIIVPEKPILSTNPDDWETKGKILDGEKLVAGVAVIDNVAYLLVQSLRKINGEWTRCGEVYTSTDLKDWKPVKENPVIIEAMPWAGQKNGVPHRVAPRTLIQINGTFYTYTRDRLGSYPGIRAVGVFSSDDMIQWKGRDKPFLDVESVMEKVPLAMLSTNDYERVYLKCATVGTNGIYIIVNLEDVEGNDYAFTFGGTDPENFDSFSMVASPWQESGRAVDNLYCIDEGWLQIGRGTPSYDSIRIQKGYESFSLGEGIQINHAGPRETVFPFFYAGTWHLVYDDNKDGGNIYIATQKDL
jgi:hypothetical protein